MVKMSEKSRVFLEKYVPEALKKETRRELLLEVYYWIMENGFVGNFDTYNDLGEEAQAVYDDIYYSNI